MEGPSLVILCEELKPFVGGNVKEAIGNTTALDLSKLSGKPLSKVQSWGKHLIVEVGEVLFRVHFLMYGSYRINERKDSKPRLGLILENGEINFYSCSVKEIDATIYKEYDWEIDTMSDEWNEEKVIKLVKKRKDEFVADVLLDQTIFAGVGNIIKNEVLYELRLNPNTLIKYLSEKEIESLVEATRNYCFQFYEWKKQYVLKKNWKIFRKRKCPVCGNAVVKEKTGKTNRWSFYCATCQPEEGVLSGRSTLMEKV